MKNILTLSMYAAICGLVLAFSENISAFLALPYSIGEFSKYLSYGYFVVGLPAAIAAIKLVKGFDQKDFWKAVFRGCPNWMRYAVYFFFGYAVLNFVLATLTDSSAQGMANPGRVESGNLMAFYSVAMAALYSAIHVEEQDTTGR
jgi:hypothetical protein